MFNCSLFHVRYYKQDSELSESNALDLLADAFISANHLFNSKTVNVDETKGSLGSFLYSRYGTLMVSNSY